MSRLHELVLYNYLTLAPWHLALLVGAVVVSMRCRHRPAARLAAVGLILVLALSVIHYGNAASWLERAGYLRPNTTDRHEVANLIDVCFRYGGALGLGLVIAAAFVGRRATAPRSP